MRECNSTWNIMQPINMPLIVTCACCCRKTALSVEDISSGLYAFNVIAYFCYPLQGVFNYIIYTRHHYLDLKQLYPDAGAWELNWRVWKGELSDSHRRNSSSQMRPAVRGRGSASGTRPFLPQDETRHSPSSTTRGQNDGANQMQSPLMVWRIQKERAIEPTPNLPTEKRCDTGGTKI
jgi:hypothetical protein